MHLPGTVFRAHPKRAFPASVWVWVEENAVSEGQGILAPAKGCQIKWVTFYTFILLVCSAFSCKNLDALVVDAILRGPAHNQSTLTGMSAGTWVQKKGGRWKPFEFFCPQKASNPGQSHETVNDLNVIYLEHVISITILQKALPAVWASGSQDFVLLVKSWELLKLVCYLLLLHPSVLCPRWAALSHIVSLSQFGSVSLSSVN